MTRVNTNLKFLKNEYIYAIIIRFISFALAIIQSILVARYLGSELKGITAYIASISSIGGIIITFGMHQAYPYFRKKYGKESIYQDYISLIFFLFIAYFLCGLILTFFLPLPIHIKTVCMLIPMLGYSRVISYVLLVEQPNLRNTSGLILRLVEISYLVFLWICIERNFYWAVSILVFVDFFKCIVYTLLLKVKPRFHKNMIKIGLELIKFGFFPMIALLMTTLNYRIDVLMLHSYDYITNSMIGVYSLGLTLTDKIVIIPDTLKGVLVSKLAKGANANEVAKVSRLAFWASCFLSILFLLFGSWIINLLYGNEFSGAYDVIVICLIGVLAISYFKLIAQYNIVNRKQILNVAILSIAIIVDVGLNLVFIPLWGINGAALATCIGNIVCGFVFIMHFCNHSGVNIKEMILVQKSDIAMLKSLFKKK